jgi:hypothetical protein
MGQRTPYRLRKLDRHLHNPAPGQLPSVQGAAVWREHVRDDDLDALGNEIASQAANRSDQTILSRPAAILHTPQIGPAIQADGGRKAERFPDGSPSRPETATDRNTGQLVTTPLRATCGRATSCLI